MGITSPKSLRYPEATTEARTLHTRIKELADDATTVLTAHDARFSGLDTKTNATNSDLSLRGMPQWRYGQSAGVLTHSPNDYGNRTISIHENQFYVHPNANYLMVSMQQASYCGAGNAAGVWEVLIKFGSGGWLPVTSANHVVHNQGQAMLDLGFHVTGVFDARPYRNMAGSVATNFANDQPSAGWITHGYLFWSVVSLT
jgi:hypothetical protein